MNKRNNSVDSDHCQPCHNALQCLVWSQEGMKSKCCHWGYFKQNYANGKKKIIGAEILNADTTMEV